MFRAVVEQLDGYGSAADMVRATFDTFFDSLDAERNASLVQHAEQHRSDSAVTDLVLAGRRRLDARVADALATWNSADRVTLEATPLGDRPSIGVVRVGDVHPLLLVASRETRSLDPEPQCWETMARRVLARRFLCSFSKDQPGHGLPRFATRRVPRTRLEPLAGGPLSFLNRASEVAASFAG